MLKILKNNDDIIIRVQGLSVMWPYPSFRQKQREVISIVDKALAERKIVGLNAPTGFGKTIVVLYSLTKFLKENPERKCLYVVRTKNEVRPVLKELALLKSKLPWIKYAFLVAKKDMCFHRLKAYQELKVSSEDFIETCKDFRNRNLCPLRKVDINSYASITEFLEEVVRRKCCPWYASKYMFDDAHFIIATYPYLFNPFIRQSVFSYDGGVLNLKDSIVVVDEAHNLESVTQSADRGLSIKTVERALEELEKYSFVASEIEYKYCREYLLNLLSYMGKYRGARKYIRLNTNYVYNQVINVVDLDLLGRISDSIRRKKVEMYGIKTRSYLRSIWRFLYYFEISYTLYYEDIGVFALGEKLELKILNPAIITSLLNESYASILMSGTLPPLNYIKDVYGLNREIEYIEIKDVFPPENKRYFCAVDVTTKYKTRTFEMFQKLALYILFIRTKIPFEYIVLTVYPSYEVMKRILAIYNELKEKYEETILDIVETENTRIDDIAKKIGSLQGGIVIHAVAGGKLTEGIELTRNGKSLIGAVIIAGLPFPEPNDYLEAFLDRMSQLYSKEKGWEYAILIPTIIKVKQAFGRAIRGPEDVASFFILDRRALSKKIINILGVKPTIVSLPRGKLS